MLWQKLQREMPSTLGEMIRIADSYALGDPTQPLYNSSEPNKKYPGNNAAGSARRNDRHDYGNKRRDEQPDQRYGSHQVATVDSEQQGAGYSQRPRYDGPAQNQNQTQGNRDQAPNQNRPVEDMFTYEKMLDRPCKYHTLNPRRVVGHKTRECSWHARMRREGAEGNNNSAPPRYPPRALACQAPQAT